LEARDQEQLEVICYFAGKTADDVTDRLKHAAGGWRDVLPLSDAALADRIRADVIDILIDLSLHSAAHRLLTFARKPAPVQVTYLAYPGTSGMAAMDYRVTDPHLDPPGSDSAYSERSLRLPRTYWCFAPPEDAPDVAPPPVRANGFVTFGCLNQFGKASEPALRAWARIMARTRKARLILHSLPGRHRQRVLALFECEGIDPSRVEFVGRQAMRQYLATYGRIDIALDPFPFAGGTTSCEALWMGVPLVSLAGRLATGRAGASILTNVNRPELIAGDVDEYIRLASELAGDESRLSGLRETMRQRMRASALMNAEQFSRDFEQMLRIAWRVWCDSAVSST
jgi:predicted O-linked N-acetylglucosamine transferase (SPINDLY family)